jgi:hypothetical protein
MLSKAPEWASVSTVATLLQNIGGVGGGVLFYRAFEIERYIKKYVKKVL